MAAMAARGEAHALLAQYVRHGAARAARGQLAACRDPAIAGRARGLRLLRGGSGVGMGMGPCRDSGHGTDTGHCPAPELSPALAVLALAERCRRAGDVRALRALVKALELLEVLCLHLLLCPWRREIRSVKTFTGNFVYYIQSVLSDDLVKTVLEKIGYVATTATEFSLVKKRNNEETKQTAFEIFLARIECETILEMTVEELKHGNLERTLQERTQTRWHQGDEDKDQRPRRGDAENTENQENSETSLCLATQQNSLAPCLVSLEAAGSVKMQDAVAQSAAAQPMAGPPEHQRQGINTAHVPGQCSDSQDFLIQYSDIVIRQTPVFGESRSPRALETEPRASVGGDCALAVTAEPAVGELAPVPLSPGASGPPAFAVFADSSCDPAEYRATEESPESIEAEIKDAMNCIDSEPGDEPSELKSLPYTDFVSAQIVPREEEVCDLSLTFTKLHIKDTQEDLTYPVEETGQPSSVAYASASDPHVREFDPSKIKHTYLTDAELQNRAAEPSSDLCCTAGDMAGSTAGSDNKTLFLGTGNTHTAFGGFRHIREPPNLTYIPPHSIDVRPSYTRRTSRQGRRTLLQPERDSPESREVKLENCNSELSENQEPYVIIDRTDPGMLYHHT